MELHPANFGQRMNRILIAEDDVTQRILWARIIEVIAPGSEILWVDSFAQASGVLETDPSLPAHFDLLISDIFLNGDPTGFDIVKKYSHRFNGRVILVSSFGEVETPEPTFNNFTRAEPIYLKKPLDVRQTVSILRKILTPHV